MHLLLHFVCIIYIFSCAYCHFSHGGVERYSCYNLNKSEIFYDPQKDSVTVSSAYQPSGHKAGVLLGIESRGRKPISYRYLDR